MARPITQQARELIARHIHSVEQLEVLLLVRAAADRDWTADDIARELVTAPDTALVRLEDLQRRGFIRRAGEGWRYAADGETARAIDDVANAYATRRFAVVELIFSKPSDQVTIFAEAFRNRRSERE